LTKYLKEIKRIDRKDKSKQHNKKITKNMINTKDIMVKEMKRIDKRDKSK